MEEKGRNEKKEELQGIMRNMGGEKPEREDFDECDGDASNNTLSMLLRQVIYEFRLSPFDLFLNKLAVRLSHCDVLLGALTPDD